MLRIWKKILLLILCFSLMFTVFWLSPFACLNISSGVYNSFLLKGCKNATSDLPHEMHLNSTPVDVALLFTHVISNTVLQLSFKRLIESILESTSVPVIFHIISDRDSFNITLKIIEHVNESQRYRESFVKVSYVAVEEFNDIIRDQLELLKVYFTSKHDAYYSDVAFLLSAFINILLPKLEKVILLDVDIKVNGDIGELFSFFDNFTASNIIGMGYELSPVYYHRLSLYRLSNPNTTLGKPLQDGGFPGFNSGVMLIDISKLKKTAVFKSYFEKDVIIEKLNKYYFSGNLGDQDLYNLIALDHPELFYVLPCQWNRQLCQWWRNKGYEDLFDRFFTCDSEIKLVHGNCRTVIRDY